jgi:hypothetical protein
MERAWKLSEKGYTCYQCEICRCWRIHDINETVCGPCDRKLDKEFKAKQKERAREWGERHKCQNCGVPLSLDRYVHCPCCEINVDDPSDHEHSLRLKSLAEKRKTRSIVVTKKRCNHCKRTMPVEKFTRDQKNADGYSKQCRLCKRRYYQNWKARYDEKLAENKAKRAILEAA